MQEEATQEHVWFGRILTGSSETRGCRCLHGLPSVVPVFGETVDNSSLSGLFLPLLSVGYTSTSTPKFIHAS